MRKKASFKRLPELSELFACLFVSRDSIYLILKENNYNSIFVF